MRLTRLNLVRLVLACRSLSGGTVQEVLIAEQVVPSLEVKPWMWQLGLMLYTGPPHSRDLHPSWQWLQGWACQLSVSHMRVGVRGAECMPSPVLSVG